ncbi:MAG: Npt1/Npt2 family nucleotide transporter [Myxococcales bacterium]
MPKPLKALFDVRRSELAPTLLMSGYFFLVITCFWILKPIKKSLFLEFYRPGLTLALPGFGLGSAGQLALTAAELELGAKVVNMIVAALAALVFVGIARRCRREQLTYVFGASSLGAFFLFTRFIDAPSAASVWSFYLFGDLFNMLMVASFFAYLNDIVSSSVARRIYAFVVLGGVIGGVFGSTVVKARISVFSTSMWLWICCAATFCIMGFALWVSRLKLPVTQHKPEEAEVVVTAGMRTGAAGARVVLGSRYLQAIACIVAIYEIVSTVMDFQFSATVSHYLEGAAIKEQLASVFLVTNVVSLLVQLLFTRFVMQELGIRAALSVLPFVVLVVAGGFAIMPLLWVGSSLSIADNALNYSVNQSARESLYVPASALEKYQAKAFIDIFVQRSAKAVGVVLSFAMSLWIRDDLTAVRYLSLVVVGLSFVWLWLARYAGNRFNELSASPAE